MNYSLEKISTVAGCDTLLALAQKKKQGLERQRCNLGESIGNFGERVDQLGSELASVQSLLKAFTTLYNTLPDGSMDKLSINVEVKRLEVREAQLYKMALTYNVRSLHTKQVNYNRLDGQVSAIDNYITAVQDKRMALGIATLHINYTEHELLKNASSDLTQPEPNTGKLPLRAVVYRASRFVHEKQCFKKAGTTLKSLLFTNLVVRQKWRSGKRTYSFPNTLPAPLRR
jgi:hypothetical protein